jgi:galactokinase
LRERQPSLEWLADASPELLADSALEAPLAARARHVISETARVRQAVESLSGTGILPATVLIASHESLRTDYECSTAALDWFVEKAVAFEGVSGARLTGAGWGGCAIALGDPEALEAVALELATGFAERFGRTPRWWLTAAEEGARPES